MTQKRRRKWKTRAEYKKGHNVTWFEEFLHFERLSSLSCVLRLVINQKVRPDDPLNISGLDQYSTDNSLMSWKTEYKITQNLQRSWPSSGQFKFIPRPTPLAAQGHIYSLSSFQIISPSLKNMKCPVKSLLHGSGITGQGNPRAVRKQNKTNPLKSQP